MQSITALGHADLLLVRKPNRCRLVTAWQRAWRVPSSATACSPRSGVVFTTATAIRMFTLVPTRELFAATLLSGVAVAVICGLIAFAPKHSAATRDDPGSRRAPDAEAILKRD